MSNRKTGTTFERELCERLSDRGFWAHNLAQNSAGQPFDVLAAKNHTTYPIDCKVCEHDMFRFSRVEENQRWAMRLWRETGNGESWFALKVSNGSIFMVAFSTIETLECEGKKSLDYGMIEDYGLILERWFKVCGW